MEFIMNHEEKVNFLKEVLFARQKELSMYQINIDNYVLALEEIDKKYKNDETLIDFKKHLEHLLDTTRIEFKKELIMINVIKKQLDE